jgi:hypothetical protein
VSQNVGNCPIEACEDGVVSARRERRIRLVNEFIGLPQGNLADSSIHFTPGNCCPPLSRTSCCCSCVRSSVTDFSAERAMEHVKVITREPHPTGSIANRRVRDYIVAQLSSQGLKPEVQKSASTTPWDIGGAHLRGQYNATNLVELLVELFPATHSDQFLWRIAQYERRLIQAIAQPLDI